MKINTLTKATKLLAEIRQLDEQIIRIDKIAMANHDTNTINKVSIITEKPKDNKAEIDTDGYDMQQSMYRSIMDIYKVPIMGHGATKTESNDFEIDEIETLIICGTLIQIKKDKRKLLVDELLALGYTY